MPKLEQPSRPVKLGILLAFYGTSTAQSDRVLRSFKDRIEETFAIPVRMAFTSEALRKRLAHARTKSDSVLKALTRMYFDKYTHVIVQSLHLIPGQEFEDFLEDIEVFEKEYSMGVYTGKSLLYNEMEVPAVAKALLSLTPNSMREQDALIFMGHGSEHEAQRYYDLLDMEICRLNPCIRVACMKCGVTLDSIMEEWQDNSHKTIYLLPLLVAIGSHALNDMAGDGKDSWKSQIEAIGYECIPHLHSLAESKVLQDIWISRIRECYALFEREKGL